MKKITRRKFIKSSLATAAGVGVTSSLPSRAWSKVVGANNDIRIAIVGLGGDRMRHKRPDKSFTVRGGKGSHMINAFKEIPDVRVVALCDPDKYNLERDVKMHFEEAGEEVDTYTDVRKVIDHRKIDAVYVATPNHWHALITVLACQAGKDVYVEKPVSWSIWEGRKMIEAARKYNRIVQGGTGMRSSDVLQQAIKYIQEGNLGKIKLARAICYRYRPSIGKVSGPQPVPDTLDYDLWTGPAPMMPLMRTRLHYDWHWVWPTGNGEIGDLGAHFIDVARWAIGQNCAPKRAMVVGGRFGYDDDGDTPNTQVACFDYEPAPLIWELRALPANATATYMDNYKGVRKNVIIHCEDGYFSGGWAYDSDGKKIKQFVRQGGESHEQNFIKAVRSRRRTDLKAEILEGHISCILSHTGNISHRVGQQASPEEIQASIKGNSEALDAFGRMKEHLAKHQIDLSKTKAVLGPWLTLDPSKEQFVGPFADKANALLKRDYRKPFVLPEKV